MSDQQQQQIAMVPQPFNPKAHLIQLKSREGAQDYLPVQWRLVWFREQCPEGTIDTEEVEVDLDREVEVETYQWNQEKRRSEKVMKRAKGYARFRAVVTDGRGGRATGTKSENAASFPDYIEKAETGAIGRALAALGYGTAFAPELAEMPRIVDAGVPAPEREHAAASSSSSSSPSPEAGEASAITEQQQSTIEKLYASIGKQAPDNLGDFTYIAAKKKIQELMALRREYQQEQERPLALTEVAELKKAWIEGCHIPEDRRDERWVRFKSAKLNRGVPLPDERMTGAHKRAIQALIEAAQQPQEAEIA